jgi:DNA invertase Pin-like site-specific DNA recombinase
MKQIVSYIRVSTDKQGKSGLGIEAQRYAIAQFAISEGYEIAAEYVEIETGKGSDALTQRPQLAAALAQAGKIKALLVVAKLDRLTRNVHFGSGLLQSKQQFRVAEMPNADNFQLHIMLAVAEKEREMISTRTKQALQAAKARGVVLGNAAQTQANIDAAQAFAETLRDVVTPLISLSSRKIAAKLNERGIKTVSGTSWQSAQVVRLVARLTKGEGDVAKAA